MEPPETRYARSGDVAIAYQVVGEGPIDLVFVPMNLSIEISWDNPAVAAFYERLASFARLILLDKRGVGISDRPRSLPTLGEAGAGEILVSSTVKDLRRRLGDRVRGQGHARGQ